MTDPRTQRRYKRLFRHAQKRRAPRGNTKTNPLNEALDNNAFLRSFLGIQKHRQPTDFRLDDASSQPYFPQMLPNVLLATLRKREQHPQQPDVASSETPVDRTTPDTPQTNTSPTLPPSAPPRTPSFFFIERFDIPASGMRGGTRKPTRDGETASDSRTKEKDLDPQTKELLLTKTNELKAWQSFNKPVSFDTANLSLRERIVLSDASPAIKSILLRKYREAYGQTGCSPDPFDIPITRLLDSNTESAKALAWVENCLEYPHGIVKPIVLKGTLMNGEEVSLFSHLSWLRSSLDQHVYGHDVAKKCILAYVGRMLAGSSDGKSRLVLCLQGSPGTGKTRLVRTGISDGLGIPMACISLGGIKDANLLTGHSSTYVGARFGAIANAISSAGQENCVIFMDEVDKVGSENAREISGVLTHALDPESHHAWDGDHYMQPIKLNLSKVVFVLACNDLDRIHSVALDRMYVIQVPDLSPQDQRVITQNHVFPESTRAFQLTDYVALTEDGADELLLHVSKTGKGMREVKRVVDGVLERFLLLKLFYDRTQNLDQAFIELAGLGFKLTKPAQTQWSNARECLHLDRLWMRVFCDDLATTATSGKGFEAMYS